MVRLEDELKACGCTLDAEEFRELISDTFNDMYRAWTDENLLCWPREALRFCGMVRHRARASDMTDFLICSTLLNIRKRGWLSRDDEDEEVVREAEHAV